MRIGVDLGGTKIEAIALANDGSVRERRRKPTPAGDYEAILAAIRDLVLGLEADLGETASLGIATPGSHLAEDPSDAQFQYAGDERQALRS